MDEIYTDNNIGEGNLLFDTFNILSISTVALHNIDRFGTDISSFVQTVNDSTSDIKGYIKITDENDATAYVILAITGAHTVHNDHFHIPVSYVSGVSTVPIQNDYSIIVTFIVNGDKGDIGYTGSQGAVGYTGSQGDIGYTGSRGLGALVTVDELPPLDPQVGDLWIDTDDDELCLHPEDLTDQIRAVVDEESTELYPVMVNASGVDQTAKVSPNKLTFNAVTGQLLATEIDVFSDQLLKTNITEISDALDIINNLEGFKFNWKDSGKQSLGIIAQDIEKILPELVTTHNQYKTVNYIGLIPILIEAVKELYRRIN
jgi:hypothetical protein